MTSGDYRPSDIDQDISQPYNEESVIWAFPNLDSFSFKLIQTYHLVRFHRSPIRIDCFPQHVVSLF
jgi:hypothetical protein